MPTAGSDGPHDGRPRIRHAGAPLERRARVIAVCGARPGVGASTLGAYTAAACAALLPHVRVVGGALRSGKRPRGDGALHRERVPPFEWVTGADAPAVAESLARLRERADLAVLDVPSRLTERTLTILDAADVILLVVHLDATHLRTAQRLLRTFRLLGYPDEKLRVIVNRDRDDDPISATDAARVLRHPIFRRFPDVDGAHGPEGGGPPPEVDRESALYRAARELAATLLGVTRATDEGEKGGREPGSSLAAHPLLHP